MNGEDIYRGIVAFDTVGAEMIMISMNDWEAGRRAGVSNADHYDPDEVEFGEFSFRPSEFPEIEDELEEGVEVVFTVEEKEYAGGCGTFFAIDEMEIASGEGTVEGQASLNEF